MHRTFKTRNKRQDQTKEQKQLALVNYATENENRCCQESRYRNKIFYCSNAACCIFVHSNSERFNFHWNGDQVTSAFVLRRRLYVNSTCSVLSSNLSTACVLFSGTATPASTANFSDTCSFSPKFNESVTFFAISCSEHVFVKCLCAITNAPITLHWRSRSVYAQWKKPTIFTIYCRPD